MSERSSYAPGTPCWVELGGVPDLDAAEAFYRDLLGWEIPEQENSAQLGGYRRAKLGGRDVAGVSPRMEDGQPTVWMTYVSVEDAAATVAKVGEAGGQTIVEPIDVMGLGTMAVFSDPTGAVCGIWQPGTFVGSELVNEYGCFGWNELGTRDVGAAREFYAAVFGWAFEDEDMGEMGVYTILKLGEAIVGGMLDIGGRVPDEVPAHWLTYFTVEDYDRAAAAIESGGGAIVNGPMDIRPGRMAVVNDAAGAVFAIMQPSAETLENAP